MGAADWDMVARPPRPNGRGQTILPPTRDMEVTDSQKLTLGGQTVTLYLTPGHTPATISAIIPVTDEGRPHVLAFWGGTGFPGPLDPTPTAGGLKVYQQQLFRYAKIGIDAKVDGLIANHAVADGTPQKALVMRSRKKGDPNPYIFGQSTFIRVMGSFISAVHAAVVTREQATPKDQPAVRSPASSRMIHVSRLSGEGVAMPGFRSLKPRVYAFALVVGLALLLPRAGRAQNLSFGSINGTVTDTSGGALPGVTVTASSPALQVGQLTATTDGEGKYQVVDLPRGTYEVRFELQGFQPLIRKDVQLTAGFVARIDASLSIGALSEAIPSPAPARSSTSRRRAVARP